MLNRILIYLIFLFSSISSYAYELDSLMIAYASAKTDSLKARACLAIGDYYENRDVGKSIKWGKEALELAKETEDQEFIVKVYNYLAYYYHKKGNLHEQVKLYLKAFQIAEKNGFHELQGGLANNIGSAYVKLQDSVQAILWLKQSIDLKRKYSTKEKLAYSISNLGSFYFDNDHYEEALPYFREALAIQDRGNDLESIALNLGNIGDCYLMLEQFDSAAVMLHQALAIQKELGDAYLISHGYIDLSWMYGEQNMYHLAYKYADSSYQIAKEMSYRGTEQDALYNMAENSLALGQKDKAFELLKESFTLWKELHNEESAQSLNDLRTRYETDRVESENMLLKKDSEIDAALISRQKTLIFASGGGLLVLVVLVYFLNKWNKDKRKQNGLLSEQKQLVEEKNKEILDSINYAKRIQAAILPPLDDFVETLPDSFIFYRPKDVVAGDFYWLEKKGETTLFAVADCTGHGVPGALVSVFCNNGLNRSVREKDLVLPGEILDNTRNIVVEEFNKSGQEVNDGMDIALCSLKGNTLKYAGAHNPLWIIRNGGIIEYRANKQPIGKYEDPEPYTTHEIQLEKGDTIYLFTDGIVDQFGGDKGKKLKSVNFKRFLQSIADKPIKDQEKELTGFFDEWIGDHEQIDDICVMGIKI